MHILKTLDFLYLQFVEKIIADMQVNDLVMGVREYVRLREKSQTWLNHLKEEGVGFTNGFRMTQLNRQMTILTNQN